MRGKGKHQKDLASKTDEVIFKVLEYDGPQTLNQLWKNERLRRKWPRAIKTKYPSKSTLFIGLKRLMEKGLIAHEPLSSSAVIKDALRYRLKEDGKVELLPGEGLIELINKTTPNKVKEILSSRSKLGWPPLKKLPYNIELSVKKTFEVLGLKGWNKKYYQLKPKVGWMNEKNEIIT